MTIYTLTDNNDVVLAIKSIPHVGSGAPRFWVSITDGADQEMMEAGPFLAADFRPFVREATGDADAAAKWMTRAIEAEARAEKAEQERDDAKEESRATDTATSWAIEQAERRAYAAEARANRAEQVAAAAGRELDQAPMTAREHLAAAWEAAHVPEGDTILPRTGIIRRYADGGFTEIRDGLNAPTAVQRDDYETRLLDPPAPKRAAWQDLADALHRIDPADTMTLDEIAEAAHEAGIRVTGEGLDHE